jgi:hypothetical protein
LVTPFGLANAPSTFQKYINWTLRGFLDDFCSAYVDDILIYTDGTRPEHEAQVKKVLQRLQEAGLKIDIDKCEFSTKSTKYLGYIIEAEKGIRMDPKKIKAIEEWGAPQSVKGVQGFLGFANFYRPFIKDFSKVAAPLTALTKQEYKGRKFDLPPEAFEAFEKLKAAFITAPILAQFDPDRETVVETDASGWCAGATLSQYDEDGVLHPCAFFSKKHLPAECNYEIYDKEMLAIIKALTEWDSELRSVKKFKVITDHKNLEYFMTARKLSERQMRWSLTLAKHDFQIAYRPGIKGGLPDALTRREQDLPTGENDERLMERQMVLLKPEFCEAGVIPRGLIKAAANRVAEAEDSEVEDEQLEPTTITLEPEPLEQLWERVKSVDNTYNQLVQSLRDGARQFPVSAGVKVSIADCSLDSDQLLFRGRRWVPEDEELRTRLMQVSHDSVLSGHPGRDGTIAILRRQYFWPGMDRDVRRFVRNCKACGRNTIWRERRHGLLKPLPIPERVGQELSMDFIVGLPESNGCTNVMVVTDRLSKDIYFVPLADLEADTMAKAMISGVFQYDGLPVAITSDRGSQLVGIMWKRVCELLGIAQRLSTAFQPETDGATERMNQVLEEFLRNFTNWSQNDWYWLLPMARLAISNRDAASTGISPFFLKHGFHARTGQEVDLQPLQRDLGSAKDPKEIGEAIVAKMRESAEFAQTSMAAAQEQQEIAANRKRVPAPAYRVGDMVWLDLRNIKGTRPSKKLSDQHAQYKVTEVISGHAYRLDVPTGVHNVFNVRLLRPAAMDPFPSQQLDDTQPPPIMVDDEEEYGVEKIMDERMKRKRGRGAPKKEYLVKWTGYHTPTWTEASLLEETEALDVYLNSKGGSTVTG